MYFITKCCKTLDNILSLSYFYPKWYFLQWKLWNQVTGWTFTHTTYTQICITFFSKNYLFITLQKKYFFVIKITKVSPIYTFLDITLTCGEILIYVLKIKNNSFENLFSTYLSNYNRLVNVTVIGNYAYWYTLAYVHIYCQRLEEVVKINHIKYCNNFKIIEETSKE